MKLSLPQLTKQSSLVPLYVIASAEPLLTQEATQIIRTAAQQAGFTERQWLSPSHQEDWQQLALLHSNLDLFSQKQLIELYIPNGKPSKQGIAHIERFVRNPNDNQILIISIDKIDKALLASRWLTQCEQAGIMTAIWPLSNTELSQWLQRRTQHYQVEFEKTAFTDLLNRTQGNLTAAEHALQQLSLFPQPINSAQLKELIADQAQFAIIDFVQSLLHHQHLQCLHILQRLEQDAVEPTWIIWQLANSIRRSSASAAKTLLPLLSTVEIGIKSGDILGNWALLRDMVYRAIRISIQKPNS